MSRRSRLAPVAIAAVALAPVAHADDIEGLVEHVDAAIRTLTVQGMTFQTTDETTYEDGLRLENLQPGQRVEIDFEQLDGRFVAKEIELED